MVRVKVRKEAESYSMGKTPADGDELRSLCALKSALPKQVGRKMEREKATETAAAQGLLQSGSGNTELTKITTITWTMISRD